ncbi:ribosome silencing factor [Thermodesulfovibrio thiophilus]|uniref:ribosome silencing factor n=1 Tax=Thermodesulfovibrio thiophilus TaxID=340095 RepID=UPI0003FFDACB|nr:ribosome silencing factor [Thermodesulfovibrio thiophilus]
MTLTTKEKAIKIAALLDNKKANDIKILEVKELTIITDYFVICSADSTTQVKALTEHLEETMKLEGFKLFGIEGVSNARWILMDYGDVIVHIFLEETRRYYDLERLWLDAPRITFEGTNVYKRPVMYR